MGLKQACPAKNDKSCQISCQDPTNAGACIRLTSLLVDGSPCGALFYPLPLQAWKAIPILAMIAPQNITDGLLFALIGYAGTCIKGSCQAASFLETAKVRSLVSLIENHGRQN